MRRCMRRRICGRSSSEQRVVDFFEALSMSKGKTSSRKTMVIASSVVLLCCIGFYVIAFGYVAKLPEDKTPEWFGYACGITAIVTMISIALLITSLLSWILR